MNTQTGKKLGLLIFSLSMLLNVSSFAERGGFGGRGFGGGVDVHEGGQLQHNEYHPGWHNDDIHAEGINGAYIAVPEGGVYNQSCVTVNNCNSYGQCFTQQNCD